MASHPSYEDIKKYAAAIHRPKEGIYGICLRGKVGWGENMALLGTMVNTYGGQWFDQNWKPQLDSPEWKNAVSTYKELLTQYGPPNPTGNGFNENRLLFSQGHCGMWIDATVAAGMVFNPELSNVYRDVDFAPAPIAVTPKGSSWLWTWALAIPESSKNKEAAVQFITWATSKEYIGQVAKNKGWVSVPPGTRASTYANADYQKAAPFAKFVLQAIEDADPLDSTLKPKPYTGIQFVGIPEFPALGHQVGLNIVKVIEGTMSVEEALKASQNSVSKLMKKSGYY
jgi:sorbitol/mannitol transport system substrate-binding protein